MNRIAASLAKHYMMTGKFDDLQDFKSKLTNALTSGHKVVQLRQKNIGNDEYLVLVQAAESACKKFNCLLLLATSTELFLQTNADGLHLNSKALYEYDKRPIANEQLLSVSCHNLAEMKQAESLAADILLISPVKATVSHPELTAIGWQQFAEMVKQVKCSVYALGGMQASDLDDAQRAGAQGVAVSSFWP